MLRKSFVLFFCSCIISFGCQSDKAKSKSDESTSKSIDKNRYNSTLSPLRSAYNTRAFEAEKAVKFHLKLSTEDSVFFDGNLILNTEGTEIKIKNSKLDTVLNTQKMESKFEKIVLWSAELYALPFWIQTDKALKPFEKDSLIGFKYKSRLSDTDFEIFKHPQTHIIEKVNYSTDIKTKPFDKGVLTYYKYITVNRIPVAMTWIIEGENNITAKAEISRISYPDKL
ncbi:hypothetical protein [Psychroflexus sp. MBR-150]|jgi:hypothetical protein